MPALHRLAIPALFVAVFLVLSTVRLDRPGFNYDEVIFVPVSLRVLGQCDVDAAVTRERGCFPLMQAPGYVGPVKALLHAPIFATFGTNVWTVRLPSILIAAAALVVLWSFARRELGGAWATLLLALLATDPMVTSYARLDWGPEMIAALLRVTVLAGLWRWQQTGRFHWLALTCAAMVVGLLDKLTFGWVIGAFTGAAILVSARAVFGRLRDGAPWQPALAVATGALLLWLVYSLLPGSVQLDDLGGGVAGLGEQVANVWRLYAVTFSGTSILNRVFGTRAVATSFFGILALVQLVTAAALLWSRRPWTPARKFLAYLTAALVLLFAAIVLSPPTGRAHHLFMLWPLPVLQLVTLLAIAAQHAGGATGSRGPALRRSVAVAGTIVCGALLAWNLAWQLQYFDAWRHNRDFQMRFDPAIANLGARLDELEVDSVIAVDRGLQAPLVTLADRARAARYREWTWRLIGVPDLARDGLPRVLAERLSGRRVAFVEHGEGYEVIAGARARLEALLKRYPPCERTDETIANTAGRTIYAIVVADYRGCAAGRFD